MGEINSLNSQDIDVIHINARIIRFLLTNTFGNLNHFSKGLSFRELEASHSLKNDQYQMSCDKISLAVYVWAYYILVNRKR